MAEEHLPPLDFALAVRRTKKDLRDEWFADALQYRDILKADQIRKHFERNPAALDGEAAEIFNLPKPSFTLRYALEASILDKILYQALIDKLIEQYDPLLSPRVASHRLKAARNRYMFRNPVEAWKGHLQAVKTELDGTSKVLLVTDIQNYYECISLAELDASLRRPDVATSDHFDEYIAIIMRLLRKWSPYEDAGIPQNRDPSAFLANVYLQSVDDEMLARGYNYFRYMDDIKVVCDDEYRARRALKDLIIELREKRLNVNARKTRILRQGSQGMTEVLPPPNRELEEIDALFSQRRLTSIRRSLPLLRQYALRLIEEGKTNEREFRFCIHRLEKVARCPAFQFDYTGITGPVVQLLVTQPWSTDSVTRFLASVNLEEADILQIEDFAADGIRNIYEWQGYLVWQLLGMITKRRGENRTRLRALAKQMLREEWAPPMTAGAVLYLGACGDNNDRLSILRNFRKSSSRLVLRSVLIATQECPAHDLERHLDPYVSAPDLETSVTVQPSATAGAGNGGSLSVAR